MTGSSSKAKGVMLVLASGACWGCHGVLIKTAYSIGASYMQVFFVEALIASTLLLTWLPGIKQNKLPEYPAQWLEVLLCGCVSTGVGLFLFLAFYYGPVAIGATLLFLYLPIVYFVTSLMGQHRFTLPKAIVILLILCGAVLATRFTGALGSGISSYSILFGVLTASCFASVFIWTPRLDRFSSPELRTLLFACCAMGISGTGLLANPGLWLDVSEHLGQFLLLAFILGLLGQILPVIMLMKGIPLTGSSLGGVCASVELPIAVSTASIFLGEHLSLMQLFGVLLVLCGIITFNLIPEKS